jgi:hypothetical protein
MRIPALLAYLSLAMAPALAAEPLATVPDLSKVTPVHRAELRCAAAFAIVASEQQRGIADALAFPPLASRGKRYFVDVSTRVADEAGLTREQVRDLLTADVTQMQRRAGNAPDAEMNAEMAPCLARLDAAVPPLKVPNLLQCTAILSLAYEEVHGREGLSSAARDLATLSSVLTAREHEALVASQKGGDEADQIIAKAHDAMLAEAFDNQGGVEKYDIARCYELAKPNEKSHY